MKSDVWNGKKIPPKILNLLQTPVVCSKIAEAWPALREVMFAVIMELPLFCKKEDLDANATVIAANKLLTTLEVFKDQAIVNRDNAQNPDEKAADSTPT